MQGVGHMRRRLGPWEVGNSRKPLLPSATGKQGAGAIPGACEQGCLFEAGDGEVHRAAGADGNGKEELAPPGSPLAKPREARTGRKARARAASKWLIQNLHPCPLWKPSRSQLPPWRNTAANFQFPQGNTEESPVGAEEAQMAFPDRGQCSLSRADPRSPAGMSFLNASSSVAWSK